MGSFNIFDEATQNTVKKKSHENPLNPHTPEQESLDDSSIHSSDTEHEDAASSNSSSTSSSDAEAEADEICIEEKETKPSPSIPTNSYPKGSKPHLKTSSWLDIGPNRGMYF